MLPHLLFTPRTYPESDERWPVMLFLHGAGERGSDLQKLRKYGPPQIVENDPDFPFILVAPQCSARGYWESRSLLELLDHVTGRLRVDQSRVYVTGVSMGGYGTWELAMESPARFAAIAPICGGGDPLRAWRLREMPIWAFHGEEDDIVPLSETLVMVEAVRRSGGDPRLTVFPGVAHDSWVPAYAMPELYQWLLEHRKTHSEG